MLALALAALAAVASLAWALVRRTDQCAELRRLLAIREANAALAERDAEEIEALYRAEMDRNHVLVKSLHVRADYARDPFAHIDELLSRSAERIESNAAVARTGRIVRNTAAPIGADGRAVGSGGTVNVPEIGVVDRGLQGADHVRAGVSRAESESTRGVGEDNG